MSFDEFLETFRRRAPRRIQDFAVLSSTESTNRLAKAILAGGEAAGGFEMRPILVVAWEQTGGRGRWGRSWSSPAGLGVYASLALTVEAARELAVLPLLAGVGLGRCLERYLGTEACRLKWPNDLLVGGRKLGGILIETRGAGAGGRGVVIGWGINHGQRQQELPGPEATSLRLEAEPCPSLARVAWETAEAVAAELEHREEVDYAIEAYRRRSIHREGELMRFKEGDDEVEGIFRGFDERGFLRLEVDGDLRLMGSGERS